MDPQVTRPLYLVGATAMYRGPGFRRCLREQVVPLLRTHPHARLWSVGCTTGEEVWSMAILLREEGLGGLGLGDKESLRFQAHASDYESIDATHRLYRRRQ